MGTTRLHWDHCKCEGEEALLCCRPTVDEMGSLVLIGAEETVK